MASTALVSGVVAVPTPMLAILGVYDGLAMLGWR